MTSRTFGFALFLRFAALARERKFGLVAVSSGVLLLQLINEALDARDWIHWTGVNWLQAARHTALTMAVPSDFLFGCRKRVPREGAGERVGRL